MIVVVLVNFPLVFSTVIFSFVSGVSFACLKHGVIFAVILHFLMGWGPGFFRFLGFVDFGLYFQSV